MTVRSPVRVEGRRRLTGGSEFQKKGGGGPIHGGWGKLEI
jgi:hypothetical protein